MNDWIGHGPVRRWRSGFLRVWCRCGVEAYPCPTLLAQQRYRESLAEQRRRSGFEDSVNNWWENPR